jgi:hypothetical protein
MQKAIAAAIFAALTIPGIAAESVCPRPLSGGGELRDGRHYFQYKSWTWPENGKHFFCNCVRNSSSSTSVFVDWRGTDLSSYILADDEIHAYSSYDSDLHEEKNMPLFYGNGLKKIDARTLIPTLKRSDGRQIQSLRLAQFPP